MVKVKNSQRAFTLIELLVVFSIITILSGIGIAGFVTFARSQTVDTNMKDLKTLIFTAQSRALSQLRDSSCFSNGFSGQGYELRGYKVVMCCSFPLCSSASCNNGSNNYELQAVYGNPDGTGIVNETCVGKKFSDSNISVDQSNNTTATYFFFNSLSGAVQSNAAGVSQTAIKGYGYTKVATVSSSGVIQ